ncbi:hypothetical protein HY004_01310, partial [Candidatus Saccharibacteria bacterium]|nr:hypothetical protein [Candidatus Saccharibacteria bacterium]
SDVIYGGISSQQEALLQYDADDSMFKNALDSLSISREDVSKTNETSIDKWTSQHPGLVVSWSRSPIYKVDPNQSQPSDRSSYVAASDSSFLYYGNAVDSKSINKSTIKILAGHSASAGNFAILKNSGNILTTSSRADRCYKTPGDTFSFLNCPNSNTFKSQTTVTNLSYKTDAKYLKNHLGDRLAYEVKLTNQSQQSINLKPEIYLGDILEYSRLTSVDTARFDKNSETLEWPSATIPAGQEKTYSFNTQILNAAPLTAYGQTNATSYDCHMSSLAGSKDDIKIYCPTPKIVERMLSEPADSSLVALAWIVFIVNLLIYIKVRIYSKEHELILKSIRRRHG